MVYLILTKNSFVLSKVLKKVSGMSNDTFEVVMNIVVNRYSKACKILANVISLSTDHLLH